MDVSAALNLDILQEATILAGEKGLHRTIKAAEVMEVPDVNEWLTEGILIISTFYSIKDRPQAQIEMFKTLIKVNGAGLMIKIGRYIKDLPQEMYDLANEYDVPIIAIPVDTSFVNVLTVLFEEIYNEKKAYQSEQLQWVNKLINSEVESLKDFLKSLSSITGENVYYENDQNRLLEWVRNEGDRRRKNFDFLSQPQPSDKSFNPMQEQPVGTILIEKDRLVIPVDKTGVHAGYLHILLKKSKDLKDVFLDYMVRIEEKTKLLLLKEQYDVEQRYMEENQFLKHLIEKRTVDEGHELQKRFDSSSANRTYGIFAMDLSMVVDALGLSLEKDPVIRAMLYKKIYEWMDPEFPGTILYHQGSFFYGMYTYKDQQNRPLLLDKLRKIVAQMEKVFNHKIYCGVSLAHHSMNDMYKALDEANLALQMKNEVHSEDPVIIFEEMGMNQILLKLKYDPDVVQFIDRMIEPLTFDDQNNEELIHTLDVFLQENGNHSKASEKLFIHRRTLRYRLTKIESILNMNLDDSESRFLLYFLLKMRKIHLT